MPKKRAKKTKARRPKHIKRNKHKSRKKMKRRVATQRRHHKLHTPKGGRWEQPTAESRLPIFLDTLYELLYGDQSISPIQWYDSNPNSDHVKQAAHHFKDAFLILGEIPEFLRSEDEVIDPIPSMIEALHRWASVSKGIIDGAHSVLNGRMPRGLFNYDYKTKIIQPIQHLLPTRMRIVSPERSLQQIKEDAKQLPGVKKFRLKRNIGESQRYFESEREQLESQLKSIQSKRSRLNKMSRRLL